VSAIKGFKGGSGSSHSPVEAPDSLHSIAYARILDLVSEGQIQGFTHGAANCLQDVYLDETPVANTDGSLNFQNVKIDSRTGTQDQLVMSGFPDVENATAVNLELKSTTPWTQSLTNLALSAVRITLSVPALQKSNTSNGDIQGYSIAYAIDVQTDSGSFYQVLSSAFTGKTTSKYQRNHRIDLPPAAHGWTIRVRRLTPNQNLATIQDVVMVDSYTQIIDALLRYPNSAYVGVIVDASQFSAIPTRAYDLMGRIIQVPSNYDPVARTYTGTWDGTFKQAWTNNPAWIFYDLATHPRYGLGQYVTAAQINKWNLYAIAQYCDGMVPNGFGGTEPRFTCTVFLQKKGDAYKVLQDLASVFRGISFWAAGAIQASADMPADPSYTYTAANVIDGKFTYSGSSKSTRYTVALVSWNDPNDFGRAKVKYVPDPAGIARYGVRVTQITGVGCTSEGQAQRVGLWTLFTSRLETETVTFKVGLDGTLVAPGQVLRVADPARAGKRQGGRIHAATATSVTVDSLPTVAIGDNLTVTLPSGVTETHAVTAIAGNTISVASPGFSAIPVVESVWVCESTTLQAATYRAISVLKGNTAGAIEFTITALLHNASKFAAIDSGAPITVPPISVVPPSSQAKPTNLILEAFPTYGAVLTATLLIIQWDDTPNAVYYDVKWRKDNGNWQPMGLQYGLTIDLPNAFPGVYQAMVIAVNGNGVSSLPAISAPYTINDQTNQPGFAQTLANEVATAQSGANSANAELANIASDNKVTSAEKPTVIRDWAVISSEQAGIDAQAVSFLGAGSAQQVAYDNAITTLANYLGGLTSPTMWNDKTGDTTVVGATFRQNFNSVYTCRQTLLNAIYAKAQNLANGAQSTANNAQSSANQAQSSANQAQTTANNLNLVNLSMNQGLYGWTATADAANWYAETGGNGPNGGTSNYVVHKVSTVTSQLNNSLVPVYPGQVIKASGQVNGVGTPNGAAALYVAFYDQNKNYISSPNSALVTTNGYHPLMMIATAPANAAFATFGPSCGYATSTPQGYWCWANLWWDYQPASVDEVPDGSTYNRTLGTRTSGGRPFIDFSESIHLNKNVDNMGDGSVYARAKAARLQNGVPILPSSGRNLCPNELMSNNNVGAVVNAALTAGAPACDGWVANNVAGGAVLTYSNGAGFNVSTSLCCTIGNGATIPVGTNYPNFATADFLPAREGDSFIVGAHFFWNGGMAMPAGVTVTASAGVYFYDKNGAYLGAVSCGPPANALGYNNMGASASPLTAAGLAPVGTVKARIAYQVSVANTNGSAVVIPAGNNFPAIIFCNGISVYQQANLDTDTVDGTTYGRTSQSDLYSSGGVNRIGLRIPGSGQQIGDQRNLKQRTVTNIPAKVPTTISYSVAAGSPATATITVGAFTVLSGSVSTSYNASSASVTGSNNTTVNYYLYMNDPGFAGGAQALIATTNPNDVYSGDGYVYIGAVAVTYPSSGSGSGSGSGGGGSGACVCAHMWLDEDTQAQEARQGFLADCLDIPTSGLRKFRRRLRGMEMSLQPCVRLTTEGGGVWEGSVSTPFDLLTDEGTYGGMTHAPDMEGMKVVTDKGIERVVQVLDIGEQMVCHQHYGGCSYAAGLDPDYRIYSHNAISKP